MWVEHDSLWSLSLISVRSSTHFKAHDSFYTQDFSAMLQDFHKVI